MMKILKSDIEYMQKRLSSMSEGKYQRWSLRDLAVVSRLVIIVNENPRHHVNYAAEEAVVCHKCGRTDGTHTATCQAGASSI